MTGTTDHFPSTDSALSAPADLIDRRRKYRTAGVAALVTAGAYLGQPLIVTVLSSEQDPQSLEFISTHTWVGAAEGTLFTVLGAAFAVLVVSVARLGADRTPATTAQHVLTAAGLLSAAGWVMCAGASVARYSSVTTGLAEELGAEGQRAAVAALDLAITGSAGVAAICAAAWLAGLAVSGHRAKVVGRPLAGVAGMGAVVIAGPVLVWSVPFGVLALIPVALVLGVGFLMRSRRA